MILFACVFLAHCLGCFFGAVLPRASFESVARDVVSSDGHGLGRAFTGIDVGDRVSPIAVSLLAFGLTLVGILLGSVIQRILPEGHLRLRLQGSRKAEHGGGSDTGRSCAWAFGREREEYL